MSSCKKCRKILRHNALLISTIIGIVLGLCVGLGVRQLNPTQDVLMWLGLPGQLYLRSLKMVIVPLVITGVITGTSSLDPRANGKISIVAICFIFLKNLLGAILGIIAFMVFKPGAGSTFSELSGTSAPSSDIQTQDVFADLLRNIVPDNFFEATFRQSQTKYKRIATSSNSSQFDNNTIHWIIDKSVGKTDGPNLLGLIFVCSLIGMALSSQKARSKLVIDVCDILGQTVITIIGWILWVTPFGVFSLMVVTIAEIQDITSSFTDLGMLIVSVSLFLIIQQIIVMPLVLFLLTKRNPFKHLLHIARPWCISFASATSSGAIPEMFRCCEANLEVNKIISRFVIPFSVTVGASGSAVYIACSSLFACSISGYTPTVATILMVGLLTTISAFAIPSVPSASIVTTVMILTSLNISTDVIVLLLTVEFILDRLRTASCVVGHTMCAVVVQHFCTKEVSQLNDQNDDDEVEININNEKEPDKDTLLMLETQVTNRNPC